MIRWIKIDRVLAMHSRQIAEHGGGDGVRDIGLLESALARPQNIAVYEPEADISRLAASYAFGIINNHPFIDGNKRTGYIVMELYLLKNGFQLIATPADKYITILKLAEGNLTEDDLAAWLREHVTAAS